MTSLWNPGGSRTGSGTLGGKVGPRRRAGWTLEPRLAGWGRMERTEACDLAWQLGERPAGSPRQGGVWKCRLLEKDGAQAGFHLSSRPDGTCPRPGRFGVGCEASESEVELSSHLWGGGLGGWAPEGKDGVCRGVGHQPRGEGREPGEGGAGRPQSQEEWGFRGSHRRRRLLLYKELALLRT